MNLYPEADRAARENRPMNSDEQRANRWRRIAANRGGCMCPDDCNCRNPWRTTYCGCTQH